MQKLFDMNDISIKYPCVFFSLRQVSFTLNEELTVIGNMGEKASVVQAPREHPFTLQAVGGQTLAVFTETSSGKTCKPMGIKI